MARNVNSCPQCGAGIAGESYRVDLPSRPDLLHYNHPPSDLECSQLHATRARARETMLLIEDEIASMEQALQRRINERDKLRTRINEYSAILHPMRSIPDDILTEIMLACLDESIYITDKQTSLDPRQMPWRLAQVCTRWRSVSLSFPRLWSSVIISLGAEADYAMVARKALWCLKTQLQRSAAHPLSVWVMSDIHDKHPLAPLLPVLLPTSPRWKQLSLNASIPSLRSFLPISSSLQSLEALYLFPSDNDWHPSMLDISDTPSINTIFASAPQLRSLVVWSPDDLRSRIVPSSQILDLEIVYAPWTAELLETISLFPNIQSFTCNDFRGRVLPREALSFTTLELNHLRSLVLACDPDSSSLFLKDLVMPSLQTLDIMSDSPELADALHASIARSNFSLKTLVIGSSNLTDHECLCLIEEIPTLQLLALYPSTCTPIFMTQLCDKPSLVPSLEQLEIGVLTSPLSSRELEEISDAVLKLVDKRRALRVCRWTMDGIAVHQYTPNVILLAVSEISDRQY